MDTITTLTFPDQLEKRLKESRVIVNRSVTGILISNQVNFHVVYSYVMRSTMITENDESYCYLSIYAAVRVSEYIIQIIKRILILRRT